MSLRTRREHFLQNPRGARFAHAKFLREQGARKGRDRAARQSADAFRLDVEAAEIAKTPVRRHELPQGEQARAAGETRESVRAPAWRAGTPRSWPRARPRSD